MRWPQRRVGLVRRNLLADRRRLVAGVLGVGLAMMLVLLLDGLWEGVQSQATVYPDRVGADLFVTQRGVANFLGEDATIPRSTVARVRATPGVRWASPVRGQFVVFELHAKKVAAYLVGYIPGQRGGPWVLTGGRRPRAEDEVVIDDALARRHDLATGSTLAVGGYQFRVVGTAGGSTLMTGFAFMTHSATDALLRSPGTTSYVLVGAGRPGAVATRLEASGLTVLTRDELAENDRELFTSIFGSPLRLMVAVAFIAGTLIVALTVYSSVAERRNEFGIMRAIGGTGRRIVAVVVGQALVLSVVGLALGSLLYAGGRALLQELRPQFAVVLTTGGALRALGAAVLMALVAAVVPARGVATAEPASVYREA